MLSLIGSASVTSSEFNGDKGDEIFVRASLVGPNAAKAMEVVSLQDIHAQSSAYVVRFFARHALRPSRSQKSLAARSIASSRIYNAPARSRNVARAMPCCF